MQELGTESAVFAFFKNMPISAVLDVVFLFTAFLSIVTLCDSMTTTISSLSINAKNAAVAEPPAKIKIFWGVTVSLVCFVNLATASTVGNVSGHRRHQAAGHLHRLPPDVRDDPHPDQRRADAEELSQV